MRWTWQLITYRLLAFIVLTSSVGCLSEIDIDIPSDTGDNIVIVSKLSMAERSSIEVRISGLSSFSESDVPITINNAVVSLMDANGNSEIVPPKGDGRYESNIFRVPIEDGQLYQLIVEVNGNRYESDLEKLNAVPKAIKIEHDEVVRAELNDSGNIVDKRYVRFFIDTPLTSSGSDDKVYLKWDFLGVYKYVETTVDSPFPPVTKTCYIDQLLNLDKIAIYNGPESREQILEKEFLLEEEINHRFSRGFYLTAYQQTLSEGAFEYWEQIKTITDLSGNFFEDPPGKIFGNFKNVNDPNEEVFGYFYATQTDTVRSFVSTNDYPVNPICPAIGLPSDESISSTCFDCLRTQNSTTAKPSYWEE